MSQSVDGGLGGSESAIKQPTAKTADDIADLFKDEGNEIPEEKPLKKEVKEVEDKELADEDTEIELADPEEDLEKLSLDDKEEDLNIEAPPRKKEILKKYPDVFKDFPFLEKIMYRDKQYSELFGSFDDAKEIADKAEVFNNFESELLAGDTVNILKNVKEVDSKAFDKLVDNYLPSLLKVDKDAYYEVVGNINKRLIMEMVREANESDDSDLKEAALIVNRFIFGSNKFTAPTSRIEKGSEGKVDEVEKERLGLLQERFESARDELQTRVDNTLKATISQYIDPKGAMSPYVKKNAIADAIRILNSSIGSDGSFTKNLDKLWRAAFDAKFSKDSLGKIQSTYLGKARINLKNAILKARAEALKGAPPVKEKEEEIEDTPSPRRNINTGRPSQPRGRNEMKKGETVADFFARD